MQVDLNQFRVALSKVVTAAGNSGVTANVHMLATGAEVVLTCTDYDVSATASCQCDGELAACVPVAALVKVVRALPMGVLVLEVTGGTLSMSVGKSWHKLVGVDADEFPAVEWPKVGAASRLPHDFAAALASVLPVVATDDGRPSICGVLFERDSEYLGLVATDGHRLHATQVDAFLPADWGAVVVHGRGLRALQAMLGEDCAVAKSGRDVVFTCGGASLKVRQIEATFPDYRKVVPERSAKTCTLPTLATADAIGRASLLGRGDQMLRLTFGEQLELDCRTLDVGDGHETVAIEGGDGSGVTLNPTYLRDALRACGGDTVAFGWGDSMSPCTVRGGKTVCVLMPMRV